MGDVLAFVGTGRGVGAKQRYRVSGVSGFAVQGGRGCLKGVSVRLPAVFFCHFQKLCVVRMWTKCG